MFGGNGGEVEEECTVSAGLKVWSPWGRAAIFLVLVQVVHSEDLSHFNDWMCDETRDSIAGGDWLNSWILGGYLKNNSDMWLGLRGH